MEDYKLTPEAYRQKQQEAFDRYSSEISRQMEPLYEESKKITSREREYSPIDGFYNMILFGGTLVLFIIGCVAASASPIATIAIFAVIIIFWYKRFQLRGMVKNRRPELERQIKDLQDKRSNEQNAMYERNRKYEEGYIAHHSEQLAVNMASSAAVKAIAGQLSLLYKKEIDEADKNGYIKTIEIIMELDVNSYNVSYVFWQKGTVSPKPRKSASFTFKEFGAQDLERPEERNGAARAISSMIQTSLLEKYITNDSTPTVTIENKKTQQYYGGSMRDIIHEDGFVITFSQINQNYEGERGWM